MEALAEFFAELVLNPVFEFLEYEIYSSMRSRWLRMLVFVPICLLIILVLCAVMLGIYALFVFVKNKYF